MNKLFKKIGGAILGLALSIGVGVAVASSREAVPVEAANANWTKVSSITSGEKYLIVDSGGEYYFDASVATIDSTSNPVELTTSVGTSGTSISGVDESCGWTITLISGSNYSISRTLNGNTTYIGRTANSNGISTDADAITNSVSVTNSNFTISGSGNGSSKKLSYNSSSGRFRYFSSGTVMLFQKAASKSLSSIALSGTYPTTFTQGDAFSHTGMTVTATYSDSSTADVTSSATFSGYNMSTTGGQAVTVSYTEGGTTKTATYSITVNAPTKTLSSIDVTTAPTKTTYEEGETFDSTGMVVTATYSDASTADVTASCSFSPDDELETTDTSVTVSYTYAGTTKTTAQSITVTAATSVTITYSDVSGLGISGGNSGDAPFSYTKKGVTLSTSSGYGNTSYFHIYKNATMTISSSRTIAKIELTDAGDSYPLSGFADISGYSNGTWNGEATEVVFTASNKQVHMTQVKVTYASTDPLVELAASSALSVSMMKGDTDTSVKVHVKNIDSLTWSYTFDEGGNTGLNTSSFISVTQSVLDTNDISTLTITTKSVGSTTLHISVSGTSCESTVPVTVVAKPAAGTMVAKLNSVVVNSAVEVQTGTYKQFTFAAEDTDGNAYAITADDVTGAKQSGTANVTISNTRVTGDTAGTAVVRYSLKVLDTVYVDITLNVVDDYITTVNSITFNVGLEDVQGETITIADVVATKVANTHFGSTAAIADNQLLFSYTEHDRANAVAAESFAFDFTHGSVVDASHKLQRVYVFTTFDEDYEGYFDITIEQANVPLTGITITNAVNDEIDVVRNGSVTLEVSFTPANTTDDRTLSFAVTDGDEGHTVTVNSSTGVVSVGSAVGKSAIITVSSVAKPSVTADVQINNVLESMTYTVSEPLVESFDQVTEVSQIVDGDYLFVAKNSDTYYFYDSSTGAENSQTGTVSVSDGKIAVTNALKTKTFAIAAMDGGYSFKNKASTSQYISASSVGSGSNGTTKTNDAQANTIVASSDGAFTISSNSHYLQMNYNNGSPLFRYYKSASANYIELLLFKLNSSGGDSTKNVDVALFNAVHNNFGSGKTYEWSESCETFNSSNWTSAGSNLKDISGFANYKLNCAVANANGNEFEQFLAKYDVVVAKFYKDCKTDQERADLDFLGRVSSGKVTPASARISVSATSDAINSTKVIVIISLVGLTAIGGCFFIRKRKEQ